VPATAAPFKSFPTQGKLTAIEVLRLQCGTSSAVVSVAIVPQQSRAPPWQNDCTNVVGLLDIGMWKRNV
jgi:hypothetical protein